MINKTQEAKVKMKIIILCFLIFLCSGLNLYAQQEAVDSKNEVSIADAQEAQNAKTPLDKLTRGSINVVTCWAEIPAGIYKVSREDEPVKGVIIGGIGGIGAAGLRLVTGLFDTVTFMFPPYDRLLMEPAYAMDSVDKEQKEYLW